MTQTCICKIEDSVLVSPCIFHREWAEEKVTRISNKMIKEIELLTEAIVIVRTLLNSGDMIIRPEKPKKPQWSFIPKYDPLSRDEADDIYQSRLMRYRAVYVTLIDAWLYTGDYDLDTILQDLDLEKRTYPNQRGD